MLSYAGIGSRNCPKEIQVLIVKVAYWLSKKKYVLRSGAAKGSDNAFEFGCDKANGEKEIYLPWKGFNGSSSKLILENPKATEISKKYHTNFNHLKQAAKKLISRDSHQILGLDLESPVEFVICYTKDGKGEGGTGQALRIAKDYNIPIFDFGKYRTIDECKKQFKIFAEKFIK